MTANFQPQDLQIDGISSEDIIFVANAHPLFSWKNPGDFVQEAWQMVARDADGAIIWDSGKIQDNESRWRPWRGPALRPRQYLEISLRVFGQDDSISDFSAPIKCELTLTDNSAWQDAHWLWYDKAVYSTTPPSPYFRKNCTLDGKIKSARLYITARGIFQASINGQLVSQDLLQPGWVDFKQEIPFVTYDVTKLLRSGTNTLGVILADGWCCGNLTVLRYRNVYHKHPELLARLEVTYEDGTTCAINTDNSWHVATGPIISADLYDGENYDARLEIPGWDTPDFAENGDWSPAAVADSAADSPQLVPKTTPPVRIYAEIQPVALLNPRKDVHIWDFGQNFTGKFRVRLRGQSGQLYRFRVAEMLNENNELYTENYRGARSEDSYICPDGPEDKFVEYTPTFTFHGFRYLQVIGLEIGNVPVEDCQVVGLPMSSDMKLLTDFSCQRPLLNRLWLNAIWGQRSNFLELPTDCPQRDERLGWTGDTQVFASTAVYNMDCLAFYRKYLRDVREAMTEDGAAPSIAPAILRLYDGAAGWGDAIVTVPWTLYRFYGLTAVVAENYEAMKRSNAWQLKRAQEYIIPSEEQFGDWLASEETPPSLVATAYFAYTTGIISQCAELLQKPEDAAYYRELARQIKQAFQRKFVDSATGVVTPRTQCALAMVLEFDLLEDELQKKANQDALRDAVTSCSTTIQTGFLGTAVLLPALCHGQNYSTACDLLLQEKYPSWLFSVLQGATTFWERWNSYSLKDGFGDANMNSFNHYAYGTVARFMLQEIGGIHYQHGAVTFKIIPDKRFAPVKASFDSPYGLITSSWDIKENNQLHWQLQAPRALQATVIMPDGQQHILSDKQANFTITLPE